MREHWLRPLAAIGFATATVLFFTPHQGLAQYVSPQIKIRDTLVEGVKSGSAKALNEIQKTTGTGPSRTDKPEPSHAGNNKRSLVDNEQAVWTGQWVRTECSEVGGSVGVGCASQPQSGPVRLILAKDYPSSFFGTIELGALREVVLSGVRDPDGTLGVSGYGRDLGIDVTVTNWSGQESGDTMTGHFTLTFHPDDAAAGSVIVRVALEKMVKKL